MAHMWLTLGQSSLTEKSYVHQLGSTKEAAASSSLPLQGPSLLFIQGRGPQGSSGASCQDCPLSPSLEAGVGPHRRRRGADEEAGLPSASWMFSAQPARSMSSRSTLTSTSSVASWRGVRCSQASSMLY